MGSFEKGFSLGDKVINTQRERERQKEDDAWRDKARGREEKSWALQDADRLVAEEQRKKDTEWQDKSRARQEKEWELGDTDRESRIKREEEAHKSTLATQSAARQASAYNTQRQKKADYYQQNLPLIQNSLEEWKRTGSMSDIFDNEFVKGTPYDPRSWTTDKYMAGSTIERLMPDIISGKIKPDNPEFISAYGDFYKDNVRASIGTKDEATGKTITDSRLTGVNFVADIDPKTPGNQNGIVLSTEITYDDGSKSTKPITNNRSTDPTDNPRVIPLQAAMQDLTSQLGVMRETVDNPYFNDLLRKENKDKSKTEMTKEYLKTLNKLDEDRAKALAEAMSPEDEKRINATFDSVALGIEKRYAPFIGEEKRSKRPTSDPKAYNEIMTTVRSIASNYDVPAEQMAQISDYILNNKMDLNDASEFIAASFKEKKGGTGVNKGDEDLLNQMRNKDGTVTQQTPEQPEQATDVQPSQQDLSQYQALSDDELMNMVNSGDTKAIQVLRERNLSKTEGRNINLPGGTTEKQRELGKARLAEYNRLIAEGKPKEAAIALSSYTPNSSPSLAQAGQ
ncbi:hypothetical protein VPAG_00063 [Vibrio phage douglas 12A4]|uniref:hypothetical protein n=1 Tax=Vibrio phage douglas 12A4 TaxID=573171 RepID=UPI0002C0BAC7|nr:hypothetical protein VPAG_00063 [Vibrio phage douglas 12A4]AGG58099.1 hypothetical protein VPAG_00063 [Vibrio phage douglas 12A4]